MRPLPAGQDLVGRSVSVEVPATTANLGAGFDALALALDLVDTIRVEVVSAASDPDVQVTVEGEGVGLLPQGTRNRFVAALLDGFAEAGIDDAGLGWRVHMDNRIPVARGLGSSAAATVAGLVAADTLAEGRLGRQRIFQLATSAEGHPDNAAAAVFGGFCVATLVDGCPQAVRFDPPRGLWVALFVPDKHLSTAAMRDALPAAVPFEDAVHNVGAAALLVAALGRGRLDLLGAGTRDRIHEPYRAVAYPELPELTAAARDAGALGACLSGAGSAVIAFSDDASAAASIAAAMARRAGELTLKGRAIVQVARAEGARVMADDDQRLTRSEHRVT